MLRNPFGGEQQNEGGHRNIPILPSTTKAMDSNHVDPMDMTPSPGSMGPPAQSSPEVENNMGIGSGPSTDSTSTSTGHASNGVSAAAATSAQQPKVVQTAFIHKLYKWVANSMPPAWKEL